MKKTTRHFVIALAVLAGLGAVLVPRWTRQHMEGVAVPFYATGQFVSGDIFVRNEATAGGTFLIGLVSLKDLYPALAGRAPLVPTGPVYRFVPNSERIDVSSIGAWDAAVGRIGATSLDSLEPSDPIHHDVAGYAVTFNGTTVRTAGPYAMTVGVSPDSEFVTVISANGRRRGGLAFFGGGYPNGPYYHELFKRVTGVKIGPTYILQAPRGGVALLSCCWEERGKYLVYHDSEGRHLWVVPGPNHPSNQVAPKPTPGASPDVEEKSDGK